MEKISSGNNPSLAKVAPAQPSLSEVKRDHLDDTRAKRDAALSEVEAPDLRRSELATFALDHWAEMDGQTSCFGVTVSADMIPDQIVDCLAQIEMDYELDLIVCLESDELTPGDIGDFLSTELGHQVIEEAVEAEKAETQDLETAKAAYLNRLSDLRAQGKSTVEIIKLLAVDPSVPEAERLKLQAFAHIMEIADAVPEDGKIIRQRLNQTSFDNGMPDPVRFARAYIFDSATSAMPSGVSEATQIAIAKSLGIERPQPSVKTGGDMIDVYKKGVGTETYIDDDGVERTRPVFLQPGENVEIGDRQYLGRNSQGDPTMRIDTEVGSFTTDLPENPSAEDMTMYGIATQWIAQLNEVNMAERFFPHSSFERGGGKISLNLPDDFNQAQRLSQLFFGAFAGYDGALLDSADMAKIPYLMQFQNQKGDAVIGDSNPEQMLADYRRQKLLNKDDTINWQRFAKMIDANRNGLFFAEQNFGQTALQDAA